MNSLTMNRGFLCSHVVKYIRENTINLQILVLCLIITQFILLLHNISEGNIVWS